MASLNDGLTADTASATGAVGGAGTTDSATGVMGAGTGSTGAAGATSTANAAATMGATADSGTNLPANATGTAGAGTDTVVVRTGAGSSGAPGNTVTSTAMAAIFWTTNAVTARTTGTASQEDLDETQASISLYAPKANLAKELYNTPTQEHLLLAAQIHSLLLQDSPDRTQLNGAENKPVVGIINIPKSSMIRVLHSFGVGTKPIGVSYPIYGKILSLVGNLLSTNPPQAMLLPREVFHKTSTRVPDQYALNTISTTPRCYPF